MLDKNIVDLYWQRSESAISESDIKYGQMLSRLSYQITKSHEDAEESVQDTYLSAWNSMPTDRPTYLGAYLSKIVRNKSLNKFRYRHAAKRYSEGTLVYEELYECISSNDEDVFETMEAGKLARLLNTFLAEQDEIRRIVFVRRYFFEDSIKDIAQKYGMSETKTQSLLFRMRKQLAKRIEREL